MRVAFVLVVMLAIVEPAHAFYGFYASRGDEPLRSRSAQVVLFREGTTTVLTIQRDYLGPAEEFVWVLPVDPSVEAESVRTLPDDTFDEIDTRSAPQLIELWERDPCGGERHVDRGQRMREADEGDAMGRKQRPGERRAMPPVYVENGYESLFVSSDELVPWLRDHGYRVPDGDALQRSDATRYLIAQVRVDQLALHRGRARLPPIRVHWESERLAIPTELGNLNAQGTLDVVVYVLALDTRWDVETHGGVMMPSELNVAESALDDFPALYASLFERVRTHNPNAFVTEAAWHPHRASYRKHARGQIGHRALQGVGLGETLDIHLFDRDGPAGFLGVLSPRINEVVTTRLHFRGERLPDELVFRPSPERVIGSDSRYFVRHPWTGRARCDFPEPGRWETRERMPLQATQESTLDAHADVRLDQAILEDVPTIGLRSIARSPIEEADESGSGCGSCSAAPDPIAAWWLLLLVRKKRINFRG